MPTLSLTDLFKMAYVRNEEALSYFKKQAQKCKNPANKLFLHFLTGKKREQQLILEQIASKYTARISSYIKQVKKNPGQKRLLINQSSYLYLKDLEDIYSFAYEYALNELDFYMRISCLVENNLAQSALDTIVDLSKDFIFDVRLAYIDFVSKQYTLPTYAAGRSYSEFPSGLFNEAFMPINHYN
jgi:hypothetical protein